MKIDIKKEHSFNPVNVTITVESQKELDILRAIGNMSDFDFKEAVKKGIFPDIEDLDTKNMCNPFNEFYFAFE